MDSQGEDTCWDHHQSLIFFFSFGWWLSLLADVVLWMGAASAVFRSFIPLLRSAAPVLVCVHQGSPYSVLTHLIPSLITWSVWFFLLPPNWATVFKHEAHTHTHIPHKDSKEKNWPKQPVLIENGSLGKAQWWCQNPVRAGMGEGSWDRPQFSIQDPENIFLIEWFLGLAQWRYLMPYLPCRQAV